jgi:hypothetical protein
MGKYFAHYKGEYRDWRFKVDMEGHRHCFYLDEFLIGQLFKSRADKWDCVPNQPMGLDGPVCGFASRHDAAEYALQVMNFKNKQNENAIYHE